jgi:outer membrane protein OmpA-like peptidoglycan-associated protein
MTLDGDKYFYSYDYQGAIDSYLRDKAEGVLITNKQMLNLADSYFRTGNYKEASKIYLDVNSKDTIADSNRINMMLQSMTKSHSAEALRGIWNAKKGLMSKELRENADFNYQLLEKDSYNNSDTEVFNSLENSPQADFSPSFYKGKLLFSSSRRKNKKKKYGPSGEAYLDIYEARITSNGRLANTKKFDLIPNSRYHKSTPQYVEEQDRIFYILSNSENGELAFNDYGKNALAIGMVYDNGFFRYMLRDLSTSFYYPFFDSSSDKLYFSANFEKGFGGTDIYYVYVNNGQIMSEPINLGPRINSPGNEIAPYIHDGSMYFSSDIFYGIGGMDVYRTNLQNDDSYSIPVNLGAGINSESHDFGFIVKKNDDNGLSGYLASNRPGGKGGDDLYGFVLNEKPGLKTISLKGKVVSLSTNQGLVNAQVRIVGGDGSVIKSVMTTQYGEYRLEIPYEERITVQSTKEGFSVFTAIYEGNAISELQNNSFNMGIMNLDDLIVEVEEKKVLDIEKFFFAKRKSDLTESITAELDRVIEVINRFPRIQLHIETHTDSRGYTSANKRISQQRADAIKMYLLKNGASNNNITSAVGYGEERIMNNCTNGVYCLEFLHNQNNRTLFVVENYDQLK